MEDNKFPVIPAILSFLVGIIGIVLFFVWKKAEPYKAKMCLYCGLAGMVFNAVVYYFMK